jgi:hypothetical protein
MMKHWEPDMISGGMDSTSHADDFTVDQYHRMMSLVVSSYI